MQRYERLWERLLTLLGTLGEVDASEPGRIKLQIDGHAVEVVMTEDEWGDLVGIPYGSFLPAGAELLGVLSRARGTDRRYVVYDTYELHLCATPEKPLQAEMEAENRRVREYLASHPDAHVQWTAFRPGEEPS